MKIVLIASEKLIILFSCITLLLSGCANSPQTSMMMDRSTTGHTIVIHLDQQKAYLYKGSRLVGISPVSTGREGHDTPAGAYHVLAKDLNHRSSFYGAYLRDGKIIQSGVDARRDPIPAGAKFVGAPMPYYLQIAPAYGLHAGYLPGYPASHGCIRMPEAWAQRFYYAAERGTLLTIYR
jgi:lipoprotein-anchoring transpeptidase ErfK/SrfK